MSVPLPWGGGGGGCQIDIGEGLRPEWGIDMPAPGSARGIGCSRDTPRRGQKNDTHHYRVAKGVSGIIILLPILGEC